ncbi:NAD(P)H-binding protein [Kytococcus sedentarius]|uniref:NADH-flavin reductase n=1 Tax=Kytococcus sedentarius (strain ATCC 14392 / DSM 20547 / JCM 11482 / CCUG 33030 / NBRC 15357 / NCTC 11040 / CCM 314 / 541) TaxID=478801 RepID=C7NF98_KYTSD|nr:NAD(P)H-binding protein [Kytococcus sedentarius]ACV07351.1 putative NADH-flavin reductase [Kytococcus sedentarius DSM 20547]QQB63309.1 NAD(P)H-binding protein [Kytococcus sedentarius]STX13804.1 Cholesterol dehydrogenase [Kytococcus sedentarius]
MKILVPGATGTVGGHVVEQALGRGHEVVAIARNPAALEVEHPRLAKAKADILDAETIEPLLAGVDAVVSTVGIGASKTPTTLYSAGTKNLVAAMRAHGVERLVVISSEVAEHWAHQGPLKLWIVLPLLQRFLGATYDDMRRMDVVLWESDLQWTAIRAPRIQPAIAKGRYRLSKNGPLRRGWAITAPDMATALLDIAERDDFGRSHVYVAN